MATPASARDAGSPDPGHLSFSGLTITAPDAASAAQARFSAPTSPASSFRRQGDALPSPTRAPAAPVDPAAAAAAIAAATQAVSGLLTPTRRVSDEHGGSKLPSFNKRGSGGSSSPPGGLASHGFDDRATDDRPTANGDGGASAGALQRDGESANGVSRNAAAALVAAVTSAFASPAEMGPLRDASAGSGGDKALQDASSLLTVQSLTSFADVSNRDSPHTSHMWPLPASGGHGSGESSPVQFALPVLPEERARSAAPSSGTQSPKQPRQRSKKSGKQTPTGSVGRPTPPHSPPIHRMGASPEADSWLSTGLPRTPQPRQKVSQDVRQEQKGSSQDVRQQVRSKPTPSAPLPQLNANNDSGNDSAGGGAAGSGGSASALPAASGGSDSKKRRKPRSRRGSTGVTVPSHTQPAPTAGNGGGARGARRMSNEVVLGAHSSALWPGRATIDSDRWVSSTEGTPAGGTPVPGTSRSHSPLHSTPGGVAGSAPVAVPPRHPNSKLLGSSGGGGLNKSPIGSPSQSAYHPPHLSANKSPVGSPQSSSMHYAALHHHERGGSHGSSPQQSSSPSLHHRGERDHHHSTQHHAPPRHGSPQPGHHGLHHFAEGQVVGGVTHPHTARGPPENGGRGFTFGRGRSPSPTPPAAPGAPLSPDGVADGDDEGLSSDSEGPSALPGVYGSLDTDGEMLRDRAVSMLSLSTMGSLPGAPPFHGAASNPTSRGQHHDDVEAPAFPSLPSPSLAPQALIGFELRPPQPPAQP